MPKPEPQEDLDKLLNEYDKTSTNGARWTNYNREPGCSKTTLRRSFILTFLCLMAVSVGWFLHVNVFMDNPSPSPVTLQKSILSGFGDASDTNSWMDMVSKSGILDRINMTAIVDYAMKHMPPSLAARLLSHIDDVKKGDFLKLFQDTQLMDGVLDYLEVPDDFPGLSKLQKKVDDYEYDDEKIPLKRAKDKLLKQAATVKQRLDKQMEKLTLTTPNNISSTTKREDQSLSMLEKVLGMGNEKRQGSLASSDSAKSKLEQSQLEKSHLEMQLKQLQAQLDEQKQSRMNYYVPQSQEEAVRGQERGYGVQYYDGQQHNMPLPSYDPYSMQNVRQHYQNQGFQPIRQQQLPPDQQISQQQQFPPHQLYVQRQQSEQTQHQEEPQQLTLQQLLEQHFLVQQSQQEKPQLSPGQLQQEQQSPLQQHPHVQHEKPQEQSPIQQLPVQQAPTQQSPIQQLLQQLKQEPSAVQQHPHVQHEKPQEQSPIQQLPVQQAPTQQSPIQQLLQQLQQEPSAVQQPTTQQSPIEKLLQQLQQKLSPVQQSVQQSPVQESPVQESPVQVSPVQVSPVQVSPVQKSPVQQSPVQQSPVQQSPVQQSPVQQLPVQQLPVQQLPVQQSPMQQSPMQESPIQKLLQQLQQLPEEPSAVQQPNEQLQLLPKTPMQILQQFLQEPENQMQQNLPSQLQQPTIPPQAVQTTTSSAPPHLPTPVASLNKPITNSEPQFKPDFTNQQPPTLKQDDKSSLMKAFPYLWQAAKSLLSQTPTNGPQ